MRTRERLPELDLLRFVAALAVTFFHIFRWADVNNWVTATVRPGFLGVEVFFTISGYVILMSAENRSAIQFLNSRISRLYPTFWICVLFASLVLYLQGRPPLWSTLFANLTMLPTLFKAPYIDIVYWTLEVEWHFYLLVLVLLFFRQMKRVEIWLWVWVASACLSHLPTSPGMELFKHLMQRISLEPFGAFFAAGCFFYLIRMRGPSTPRLAAVVVTMVLAMLDVCAFPDNPPEWGLAAMVGLSVFVMAAFAAFLLMALRIWRLPHWPVWGFLGGLTYPLYLIHSQPGHALWLILPGNVWLRCALAVVAAVIVAAVLSRYSERRLCGALHRKLDAFDQSVRRYVNGRRGTGAV